VAGGGGTGNAELAGAGSWRLDLRAGGREPRASRRSGIAAALLLAAWWGARPLYAAAVQTACPPLFEGFQTVCLVPEGSLGAGGRYGSAVAMGDGVVAVGAYLSDAVYLFSRKAGIWKPVVRPLVGGPGDWFGFDVAIDGTQLLVGAPRAPDGFGARTGAAYRFDLSKLASGVMPKEPLPIPRGLAGDEIGSAVGLSGNCWAVGARSDGQAGAGAGSVYASCLQGQVQKLLPSAPAAGAEFGQSLSLDGNILVVGAPLAEPAGAAYIFEAVENVWQQGTQLPTDGVPAGAAFGYAVAVSDNQVVVGAPLDDGKGPEAGAAYLYSLAQAQGPGQRLDAGAAPAAQLRAQFGVSVAFDRSGQRKILVGARRANGDQGAAYLFSSDGRLGLTLSSPLPQPGADFGFESAIRDGTFLVGAFLQDKGVGAAYLFVQGVTVTLAASKIAFPESAGTVLLPVVVATTDGQPTGASVTVQVEAVAGAAPAGSHFQLLTHQVTITIPKGQGPGVVSMVQIAFVPDPPCMGDETFSVELRLDPKLNPPGAALGTPSTEKVTLHDDLAGLAIVLAHPPALMTSDDGAADHFTVALCSHPTAAVAVHFIGAAGFGVLTPPSLVFTPSDWNRPQTVTIRGVEGPGCLGDLTTTYAILLSTTSADARYAALSPPAAPTYSVEVAYQHHDRTEIAARLTVSAACDGTVLYTLVLTNQGECGLYEVSSTQLVDGLSWEDLSLVAATADRGTVSVDFMANRVAWSGAIPPGAQAVILIDAAIQAGVVAGQPVSNQAVLAYASQPGGPGDTTVTTNRAVFNAPVHCPLPGPSGSSFYTLPPCRFIDTRNPGDANGPALNAGDYRMPVFVGNCGIPVGATAVSMNITVVNHSSSDGYLTLYPELGVPAPNTSTISFGQAQVRANNAVLKLNGVGSMTVFCAIASGTVDYIVDVNGYFQ
jgi:FG-GAP repeat